MDRLPEETHREIRTATGVDKDNFHLSCSAGHTFAVSRWTLDGDIVRCNYPGCVQEYSFRAGLYSQHRKSN